MRLRLGRSGRALIVAPHPDDETIGAGLLIGALRRRGWQVAVVIVTDGAASHAASRTWPKPRLVLQRRRESRHALRRLGVAAGALAFLALPDGALAGCAAQCRRALRREVARSKRVDLIVGPARDDDHPDHRAVAAAIAAAPTRARRLAYRIWPARARRGGRLRGLHGAQCTLLKRSLIGAYRSQLGAIRDDPAGFAIARHELAGFAHPIERFTEIRR